MFNYSALIQAVVEGDDSKSVELTNETLKHGVRPRDIVDLGLQAGMRMVGDKFSAGDFFVPEMLLAARATIKAMEVLRPHLAASDMPTLGRVVIGTVSGDIHTIGKNLVVMFLQGAGFEVFDLGISVSADRFVTAVKEYNPDILGMSALLTTTMGDMEATIKALGSVGLRSQAKVVVGGAPVTQRFADQIGADGYAADGGAAIGLCRKLVGK